MAKEVMHAATYVETGVTAIAGATAFGYELVPIVSEDPGEASDVGTVEEVVTGYSLKVTVEGQDDAALLALVGVAAANIVGGYKGVGAANRKRTFKNIVFNGRVTAKARERDAGGKLPTYSIQGTGLWASSDTPATMIVDAADA